MMKLQVTESTIVTIIIFSGFFCLSYELQLSETFDVQYEQFNSSNRDNFVIRPWAGISNGALQLTPDTANSRITAVTRAGRVLLPQKFKLWEASNSTVASFNTSFLFNLFNVSIERGEGFAFVIVPNLNSPPPESNGGFLGLTNPRDNGILSNKFVAVEFDTNRQQYDPDDNHVGLNLNDIQSQVTDFLSPHGIDLVSNNRGAAVFYNVWIEYDGDRKAIEVYIAEQTRIFDPTPPKPVSPILRSDLDLRDCLSEHSYFGFSGSNGDDLQLKAILRWNLTVKSFPIAKHPRLIIPLATGISAAVILVVCIAVISFYIAKRTKKEHKSNIVEALKTLPGTAREYKFRDLKKATNNFDDKWKLGKGGYGVVYRAMLQKENLEVAVKWFSRDSLKGENDFLAELTIINRLRHKHLVRLLGWCHNKGKLLLVYEYMPNGSLDMHLFGRVGTQTLSWDQRYKISIGVASALHYLHNEFDQRVVHRDLKASNIMLDSDFNARLGDFGLARALDNEKTSYIEADGVHGTLGYIAPECFHTGKATQQSDIYAFGTVLMELVCGRKPGIKMANYYLLSDWVWSLYREGRVLDAVDEKLKDEFVSAEAERILLLGLACSHPIACQRPKTRDIVQIILGLLSVPDIPQFKPSFVWPATMQLRIDSQNDFTTDDASVDTTTILNKDEVFSTSYIRAKKYVRNTARIFFTS